MVQFSHQYRTTGKTIALTVRTFVGKVTSLLFNMLSRLLSCVQLFATPWTVASQAPLSMEFSRQDYCSGLPFPSLMTYLDNVLISKDITLPTSVRTVKAMVFPVVMYGCESWTIKKAEHQRIDSFKLWCWRRLLKVPWTARSQTSQS